MDSNDHTSAAGVEFLVALGEVLCQADEPGEAESVLTQALHIQPGNPQARVGLGLALQGQAGYLDATEQFLHAIGIEPYYPEYHWRLAWSLILADRSVTGRLADAEDAYRRASAEDGGRAMADRGPAWLHLVQGRRDAAYLALRTSIRLDPVGPAASRAHLLLGALDSAGSRTTAQAHLASVLKAATHPTPSLDYVTEFRLHETAALAHAALGNITNAVAALRCAMQQRVFQDQFEPQLYALLRQARGLALDGLVEVWGPHALGSQPFAANRVPPEGQSVMPSTATSADIKAQQPAATSSSPLPHRAGEGEANRVRLRDVVVPAIGGIAAGGGALVWPWALDRSALWDASGAAVLAVVFCTLLLVCCLSLRFPDCRQDVPMSTPARRPFMGHTFGQRLLRRLFVSTSTSERRKP